MTGNEGGIDPTILAADGDDVLEGVEPPTKDELEKARHADRS